MSAYRLVIPLVIACLVLAAIARPSDAQIRPGPGDEAPSIGEVNWLMNHPILDSLEDLRGHVVLLKSFIYNQEANQQLIPKIQSIYEEYAPRGLKVLSVGGEFSVEWDVMRMHRMYGATYPVGRAALESYPSARVSIVWLILPDGTVTYAAAASNIAQDLPRNSPLRQGPRGRPPQLHFEGLDTAVEEAMDSMTAPGFPIAEPTRDVERLARQWQSGDLGRVREQINRALDRGRADEETAAQMQQLLERIEAIAEKHFTQAERYVEAGSFQAAIRCLEAVEQAFGRGEEADRAEEMLEMLDDDEYEAEIEAEQALRALISQIIPSAGQNFDGARAKAQLEQFAERNEGTKAGAFAETLADQVEVED